MVLLRVFIEVATWLTQSPQGALLPIALGLLCWFIPSPIGSCKRKRERVERAQERNQELIARQRLTTEMAVLNAKVDMLPALVERAATDAIVADRKRRGEEVTSASMVEITKEAKASASAAIDYITQTSQLHDLSTQGGVKPTTPILYKTVDREQNGGGVDG